MTFQPVIAAADIGSVQGNRFGWALRGPDKSPSSGQQINQFTDKIAQVLNAGRPLALGFECPLFVPVRLDPKRLTKARIGEGNRAWCAAPGASALATGLVEVAWILRRVGEKVIVKPNLTLQWEEFVSGGGLLLWEAFVSGKGKSNSHVEDAVRAVDAFEKSLPDPAKANMIQESKVLSLAGTCALWSGWRSDVALLRDRCLVIAPD